MSMSAVPMRALPTGGGIDFLDRLAIAEARDSHRGEQPTASARTNATHLGKPVREDATLLGGRRRIHFHPEVITRVEDIDGSMDAVMARKSQTEITQYSEDEEQNAIQRTIVKMQLNAAARTPEREVRQRIHAIAADEAWRRADELHQEMHAEEAMHSQHRADPNALQQRQHAAARRCVQQAASPPQSKPPRNAPNISYAKPQRPQTAGYSRPSPQQQRPPSPRARAPVPGRAVPQRGTSPRRRPDSSGRPGGPPRPSTRVVHPPGGGSSFIFG
jgi:hypothetical protein